MNYKLAIKVLLIVIVLLFSGFIIFIHVHDPDFLFALCREDGIFESLSSIFYFIASALFLYVWKKHDYNNLFYLGFSALFFVVAGEEISWGQRIFGIETPDVLIEINVQSEFNIHNIGGIHENIRMVSLIIVFLICYLIPLTNVLLKNFYERIKMPIFPGWSIGIVTISILFMAIPRLMFNKIYFNLDEIGEFYLSIAFLSFAIVTAFTSKDSITRAS